MPNRAESNPDLTPEALQVLQDIQEETRKLREIDLGETPPDFVWRPNES
jgi:hypothetical protein